MEGSERATHSTRRPVSRLRTPPAYRICDGITEGVLYFAVVFAPWAFGTTQRWSIWTMNGAGYALGALLLAKWMIRWRTGYRPMRWGESEENEDRESEARSPEPEGGKWKADFFTTSLATLTVAILAYCLISALNARSTFIYHEMAFVPHDYVPWLPHTYDSWATWQSFWMYLGLALIFWASRDWLLGKTSNERREAREDADGHATPGVQRFAIPMRLQRLLWVLCLNGALLALEGILQRLSGTGKLLWLVQPVINKWGEAQFGPYAYRSNAAQYLNLLWPVCLGFWWTLRRLHLRSARAGARVGAGPHMLLLPCAILVAAAPIISTSRGGAIVAAAGMLVALPLLMFAERRGRWRMRLGLFALFAAALGLAACLGWKSLAPRLDSIFADKMSGRLVIYRNAAQIARDYPTFGTGPGTFAWVYQLYRANASQVWEAYAHNDWLETRITFGWVGFTMILTALLIVLVRRLVSRGIAVHWLFVSMIWLAMGGCLLHARFDFPFQIYSTLALFLQLCAILFCLSRKA